MVVMLVVAGWTFQRVIMADESKDYRDVFLQIMKY